MPRKQGKEVNKMKKIKYYKVRDIENLKEMLETSCKIYGEKVAYLTKEFGDKNYKEIKYKELIEEVNKLGTALINKGLKGKKIAVIGENRYTWACSYLATVCGTGIIVPLDRMLPKQEIMNCLERAHVSAIIYSDKVKDVIEEIAIKQMKDPIPSVREQNPEIPQSIENIILKTRNKKSLKLKYLLSLMLKISL